MKLQDKKRNISFSMGKNEWEVEERKVKLFKHITGQN